LDLIRNPTWHWRPFLAAGATPRFPDIATQEVGTDLSVALPNRLVKMYRLSKISSNVLAALELVSV
jgi:hypothetical protein